MNELGCAAAPPEDYAKLDDLALAQHYAKPLPRRSAAATDSGAAL